MKQTGRMVVVWHAQQERCVMNGRGIIWELSLLGVPAGNWQERDDYNIDLWVSFIAMLCAVDP